MSTATETKERPILFSAPMVRAILAGRKTQTRRIVKSQPVDFVFGTSGPRPSFVPPHIVDGYLAIGVDRVNECLDYLRKPYARPGDRLWVRERWRIGGEFIDVRLKDYHNPQGVFEDWVRYAADDIEEHFAGQYRPSIHMPRWASRITLEVVSVCVERLNDISQEDAQAEGVDAIPDAPAALTHRTAFAGLWKKINGPESWDANPWVWVVEFKRL